MLFSPQPKAYFPEYSKYCASASLPTEPQPPPQWQLLDESPMYVHIRSTLTNRCAGNSPSPKHIFAQTCLNLLRRHFQEPVHEEAVAKVGDQALHLQPLMPGVRSEADTAAPGHGQGAMVSAKQPLPVRSLVDP